MKSGTLVALSRPVPLLVAFCAVVALDVRAQEPFIPEISGVVRDGCTLLLVSDNADSQYFQYELPTGTSDVVRLDLAKLRSVPLRAPSPGVDLEGISVLADGRVVVLSERDRALVTGAGVVAWYPDELAEFGNRGLEGVAVREGDGRGSVVAVLWEGGYPEAEDLPRQIRDAAARSLQPLVLVHQVEAGEAGRRVKIGDGVELVALDTPRPPGDEPRAQRFRAPDLVWTRIASITGDEWGFIVLLSSQNGLPPPELKYEHVWLQRFDARGQRVGEPLDLKAMLRNALADRKPGITAELVEANWEGLGWYEPGKKLVLVHDKLSPPAPRSTALIVDVPAEWRAISIAPAKTTRSEEGGGRTH